MLHFAARFYPEANISGRLRLGIRELWLPLQQAIDIVIHLGGKVGGEAC